MDPRCSSLPKGFVRFTLACWEVTSLFCRSGVLMRIEAIIWKELLWRSTWLLTLELLSGTTASRYLSMGTCLKLDEAPTRNHGYLASEPAAAAKSDMWLANVKRERNIYPRASKIQTRHIRVAASWCAMAPLASRCLDRGWCTGIRRGRDGEGRIRRL